MYIKLLVGLATWMVGFWLYGATIDRLRHLRDPRSPIDDERAKNNNPKPWWRKLWRTIRRGEAAIE